MNFCSLLQHHGTQTPDRNAFVYLNDEGREQARLKYTDLHLRVMGLHHHLRERGLADRKMVLVLDPGIHFPIAFFACITLETVAVPLPPMDADRAEAQVQFILDICTQCDTNILLTDGHSHALLTQLLPPTYTCIDVADIPAKGGALPAVDAHAPAAFLYTSGSTSAPKGVMIRHRHLLYNARSCCAQWGITQDSVLASWMPNQHSFGLIYNLLLPVYSGCTLVVCAPGSFLKRPRLWFEMVARYRCTHGAAAAFGYKFCTDRLDPKDLADLDLSSWRVGLISAEPVRRGVCDAFLQKFRDLGLHPHFFCALYGLSETGPVTSMPLNQPNIYAEDTSDHADLHMASVGAALPECSVCIVSEDGELLPEGQSGQVLVAAPSLMDGYFQNEAANQAAFTQLSPDGPRYLCTGDQGFLKDNRLFLTGRLKEMIIIRGKNFYPHDVEWVAQKTNPVLEQGKAAAFGISIKGEEAICLALEVTSAVPEEAYADLVGQASQAIGKTLGVQLARVVLAPLSVLPTTASGKIRRGVCRDMLAREELTLLWDSDDSAPVQAGRGVGEVVRAHLAALLHQPQHAFPDEALLSDLGLDSLGFTQLADQLSVGLNRPIHPTVFFRADTVGALVALLEQS